MSKFHPSERVSNRLALVFSGLFYAAVVVLVLFGAKSRLPTPAAYPQEVLTLNISQIELQAAESVPEPPPEVKPEPVPDELAPVPEPVPAEPDEPVVESVPDQPPPEPRREPVREAARVTQTASAPAAPLLNRNVLFRWVRQQIEKEKYYPLAARNAGYEGSFRLRVKIGTDGKVSETTVLGGRGHLMLRRSLEKILTGLVGRDSGQTLPEPHELDFEFEFKLN